MRHGRTVTESRHRIILPTVIKGRLKWLLLFLGIVLGGAFLQLQIQAEGSLPRENLLAQGEFELRVTGRRPDAMITGMCLHPTYDRLGVDELSCDVFVEGTGYEPKMLLAARPYRPVHLLRGRAEYPSVKDYVIDAGRFGIPLPLAIAWWEKPSWMILGYEALGIFAFITLMAFTRSVDGGGALSAAAGDAVEGFTAAHADQPPKKDAHTGPDATAADVLPPPEQIEYSGKYYPVAKSRRRAFSLIELLVVIGIVFLLAAFLLPVIRTSREQAKTTRCASQLAQIGLALNMYANSNGGWLPAWSGWHTWPPGGPEDDDTGPAWTIEMIPYLGMPDSAIYNCPSFPYDLKCRNYFLAAQWAGRSGRHAMKLSDIKTVSRFVLSGDKTKRSLYPRPIGKAHLQDDADPDDFGAGEPILSWPWTGGFYMHARGNNVLFDDGHVELMQQYDPTRMTFSPTRMEDWSAVTPN